MFILKNTKGNNFRINADGVKALILCIPSDDAFYLFEIYENNFGSSKVQN